MKEFDLKEYNKSLEAMYTLKSSLMFSNDTQEKSLATIIKILELSKHVKIIVESIQGSLYNRQWFMDALQLYLSKGNKIEIIVIDDESYTNKYSLFKQEVDNLRLYIYKDQFSIKKIEDRSKIESYQCFMLGDDDKFRFESVDFKLNNAIACMSKNEDIQERFYKIFDKINECCIEI
jgi:hypothetical protein